jgi:hypothetical protein
MSDEDEEEERRRRMIIRGATESSALTVGQQSMLRGALEKLDAGGTLTTRERSNVRRLVGKVAAG